MPIPLVPFLLTNPGCPPLSQDPKHHLESYWHRGSGGLRAKGHDVEEEAERLRELEARKVGGRWGEVE